MVIRFSTEHRPTPSCTCVAGDGAAECPYVDECLEEWRRWQDPGRAERDGLYGRGLVTLLGARRLTMGRQTVSPPVVADPEVVSDPLALCRARIGNVWTSPGRCERQANGRCRFCGGRKP